MTERIRNGHGHRAYRRKAEQVKHRAMKNGTPCAWCGQPFDWTLPPLHAMAFTADHVQAIVNGGSPWSPRMAGATGSGAIGA